MMGGALGSLRDLKAKKDRSQALADYANKNPDAFTALKTNYDGAVRDGAITEEQDVALATNNMFAYKNYEDDRFFNYVRSRAQAGYFEDVIDNINDIRALSNKEFAESFGYEGLTDSELSDRKDKVVERALRKAELIRKASKTVDKVYRGESDNARMANGTCISLCRASW